MMNWLGPGQRPHDLGQLLRHYRKREGLTYVQLMFELRRMDYPIGASTMANWERGYRLPNDSGVFHFLGKVLHLSKKEEEALVQAWLAEIVARALENYRDLKEEDE